MRYLFTAAQYDEWVAQCGPFTTDLYGWFLIELNERGLSEMEAIDADLRSGRICRGELPTRRQLLDHFLPGDSAVFTGC